MTTAAARPLHNADAALTEPPRLVLRRHAATFAAASALLAPGTHDEIALLYRFCRVADDLADEQADRDALDQMILEIKGECSPSPLIASLLQLSARGVPLDAAVHLVQGCRSDIGSVRMADADDLIRYAYQVAGTVGRLCCPLLGVNEPRAEPFAVDLGIAMQLTNIARDVAEDAARDRVYLPGSWLAEEGTSHTDVLEGRNSERIVRVVHRLLDLAEFYYRSADAGLRYLPFRARLAVALAARRYRGIGLAVRARGAEALADRTVLGLWQRARYLLGAPFVAVAHGFRAPVAHASQNHRALAGFYP